MAVHLTEDERFKIRATMSAEQLDFIDRFVKRGRANVFHTQIAKSKGIALVETMSATDVERILDDWMLVDFEDAGPDYQATQKFKCQCGRTLRYRYTVKHIPTGDIIYLGETHFEEHLGMPPAVAKAVAAGFHQIDLEQDEILSKYEHGWKLSEELPYLPSDFQIPDEFMGHLSLDLPLLTRQVKRLITQIQFERERIPRASHSPTFAPRVDIIPPQRATQSIPNTPMSAVRMVGQINLTDALLEPSSPPGVIEHISPRLRESINGYLQEGVSSARVICELLIKHDAAPAARYVTGKPQIYPLVCLYLEELVGQGQLTCIEAMKEDREYKVIQNVISRELFESLP